MSDLASAVITMGTACLVIAVATAWARRRDRRRDASRQLGSSDFGDVGFDGGVDVGPSHHHHHDGGGAYGHGADGGSHGGGSDGGGGGDAGGGGE